MQAFHINCYLSSFEWHYCYNSFLANQYPSAAFAGRALAGGDGFHHQRVAFAIEVF